MISNEILINSDAIYQYGSRVYGTNQINSDWDYVCISKTECLGEMDQGKVNITYMSSEHFQNLLNEHNIMTLECFFLDPKFILKKQQNNWDFKLNLSKLRHSISEKASNSFVKAKKKFISPYTWASEERERGKKSLFHAFRILDFGIQIATESKISNYGSMNHIFEDIISNPSENWDDYQKIWKPEFNKLNTEFKKVAPK